MNSDPMPLAKKPEPVIAKPETSMTTPPPHAGGAEAVGGAAHAVLGGLRGAVDEDLDVAVLAELAVPVELGLDPGQLEHGVRAGAMPSKRPMLIDVGRPAGVV